MQDLSALDRFSITPVIDERRLQKTLRQNRRIPNEDIRPGTTVSKFFMEFLPILGFFAAEVKT